MGLATQSPMTRVPADYCPAGSERRYTLREGPNAGKTLFYYDVQVGERPAKATVLLVHGFPECSYTYRHVRDHLIASGTPCRLIAMDHLGFGRSDPASFEMVDLHHAAHLRELIEHLDLQQITLLVHDWGGPIGIGALIDAPERVDNLVVMNSTVFPMPATGYTYANFPYRLLPWCRTADLIPARLWGSVAAYVVSHASPQSLPRFAYGIARMMWRDLSGALTRDMDTPESVWCAQFGTRMNALSAQRNVRHTRYWGHGYRYEVPGLGVQDTGPFYRRIQDRIGKVWGAQGRNIGVAGYFGGWDACGKDEVIQQWQTALPQMTPNTHRYPDVGHFVEEYKGAEIAEGVLALITR